MKSWKTWCSKDDCLFDLASIYDYISIIHDNQTGWNGAYPMPLCWPRKRWVECRSKAAVLTKSFLRVTRRIEGKRDDFKGPISKCKNGWVSAINAHIFMHFEATNFLGSKFSNIRITTSIDEMVLKWLTYNCIMTNPWEKNRESYIYICCKEYICIMYDCTFYSSCPYASPVWLPTKNFHLRNIKTTIRRSEKKTSRTAPGSSPQVLKKKRTKKLPNKFSKASSISFCSNPSAAQMGPQTIFVIYGSCGAPGKWPKKIHFVAEVFHPLVFLGPTSNPPAEFHGIKLFPPLQVIRKGTDEGDLYWGHLPPGFFRPCGARKCSQRKLPFDKISPNQISRFGDLRCHVGLYLWILMVLFWL